MQDTSLDQIDAVGSLPSLPGSRLADSSRPRLILVLLLISQAYTSVVDAYRSHVTRSIAWRKTQLKQLGWMVQQNEKAFEDAVLSDLGRPAFETITAELNPMKGEVSHVESHRGEVRVDPSSATDQRGLRPPREVG